ncbi:MAG: GNAT family N-acetyltransferase [Pyrinomonadaceae bacterium]|nr:GNAT family N-acetyltransferase [Pyrinomonadaceae bacterium]
MSQTEFKIRRGVLAEAVTLAPFAVQIFNDTFAGNPLNAPEDMHAYISEFMSVEAFEAEFQDADSIFFIAEAGDAMIGYAKLQENSIEECVSGANPIELQRLYVATDFHGTGIAGALMNECFAEAARKNYQTMWLGVWEHNFRAQKFYEKLGFRQVGTHVFQLGADAQIDWVMERKL